MLGWAFEVIFCIDMQRLKQKINKIVHSQKKTKINVAQKITNKNGSQRKKRLQK